MTKPRRWIFDNPVKAQPDTQRNEQVTKQLRSVIATANKFLAIIAKESVVLQTRDGRMNWLFQFQCVFWNWTKIKYVPIKYVQTRYSSCQHHLLLLISLCTDSSSTWLWIHHTFSNNFYRKLKSLSRYVLSSFGRAHWHEAQPWGASRCKPSKPPRYCQSQRGDQNHDATDGMYVVRFALPVFKSISITTSNVLHTCEDLTHGVEDVGAHSLCCATSAT